MKKYFSLLSRERESGDKREKISLSSEIHGEGGFRSEFARIPSSGVTGGNLGGNLVENPVFVRSGEENRNLGDGGDFSKFRRSVHSDANGAGIQQGGEYLRPPDRGKPPDLIGSGPEKSRSEIEARGEKPLFFRSGVESTELGLSGAGSSLLGINYAKEKNLRVYGSSDPSEGGFRQMGSYMPCFNNPAFQRVFAELQEEQIGTKSNLDKRVERQEQKYDEEFPSLPRQIRFQGKNKFPISSVPINLSNDEDCHLGNVWKRTLSFAQATRNTHIPPNFPGIAFRNHEMLNGKPIVRFTSDEIQRAAAPLKYSLVGKFTNSRPTLMEILTGMKRAIQFKEEIFPAALDQRHVLIRFQNKDDFIKAYVKDTWWFGKRKMRVFRWTPSFSPGLESAVTPVWIGLRGIRPHLLDHGIPQSLVNPIGTFLCTHQNVKNFSRIGYAEVCVEIDLRLPLIKSIMVDNGGYGPEFEIFVDYLNLPSYCSFCGMMGHLLEKCRRKSQVEKKISVREENVSKDPKQQVNTWAEKKKQMGEGDIDIRTGRVEMSDRSGGLTKTTKGKEVLQGSSSSFNNGKNNETTESQEGLSSGEGKIIMLKKLQKWKKVFRSVEYSLNAGSDGLNADLDSASSIDLQKPSSCSGMNALKEQQKLNAVQESNNSGSKQMYDISGIQQHDWMTGRDSVSLVAKSSVNEEELLYAAHEAANMNDSGWEIEDFDVGKQRIEEFDLDSDRYVSDPETSSAHRTSMMHRIPRKYRDGLKDISDLI